MSEFEQRLSPAQVTATESPSDRELVLTLLQPLAGALKRYEVRCWIAGAPHLPLTVRASSWCVGVSPGSRTRGSRSRPRGQSAGPRRAKRLTPSPARRGRLSRRAALRRSRRRAAYKSARRAAKGRADGFP